MLIFSLIMDSISLQKFENKQTKTQECGWKKSQSGCFSREILNFCLQGRIKSLTPQTQNCHCPGWGRSFALDTPHLCTRASSSESPPTASLQAWLWVNEKCACVKHSDVFWYFKNKYCHTLCSPSLSSFPRIKKKKHPISHNNIAENPKWFISWLIYFVITDLLVKSRIIFFHFAYLCYLCSEYFHCAVIAVHGRCSQSALIQIKLSVLLMYTHNDVYV